MSQYSILNDSQSAAKKYCSIATMGGLSVHSDGVAVFRGLLDRMQAVVDQIGEEYTDVRILAALKKDEKAGNNSKNHPDSLGGIFWDHFVADNRPIGRIIHGSTDALITEIKDAITKHENKGMGYVYFDKTCIYDFQHIAQKTAVFIEERGYTNVDPVVQDVACALQKIGAAGFNDPNKLGHAFKAAISEKGQVTVNPFLKMRLG